MNTLQIVKLFKNYRCYVGTYARNQLPDRFIPQRPFALIMNTDPIDRPGQHWVAIFVDENNDAVYFDSYGFPPLHIDVNKFFDKQKVNKFVYNTKQIQGVTSTTCGAYCVTFLKLRCQNISFPEIIQLNFNDETILKLI